MSESFVGDLAALHRQTGDVAARPRGGGRQSLATPVALKHLGDLGRAHDDHTMAEHPRNLPAAGLAMSAATVGRMLLRLRLTRKKRRSRMNEASTERVKGLHAAWPEQIAGVRAEDFVFMDESGVNRAMPPPLRPQPLRHARRRQRPAQLGGDNVSLLGALCLRGTLEPMCVNGATDGRVFLTYLEKGLLRQLWPGAVVVMDNLGAHQLKGVRELIEAVGARLLYLPPYSADFNPSEMAWSKLKSLPRKTQARTSEALDCAIGEGLHAVNARDARGFFKHGGHVC